MKSYLPNILLGDFSGEAGLRAELDDVVKKNSATIKVLYHSLSLRRGSWVADAAEGKKPAPNSAPWVRLRLNELGFLAGPIDGSGDKDQAQLKRAVRRFTEAAPGLAVTEDATDGKVQAALAKDDVKNVLLGKGADGAEYGKDDKTAVEDPAVATRLWLDHDSFYDPAGQNGANGFYKLDGHADKDKATLDRFELPLEARVLLVSKAKTADAADGGIDAPAAVGDVEVEWVVHDPPEDVNVIPAWTAQDPSAARSYVGKVRTWFAAAKDSATDALDNCPTQFGGVRTPGATDPASSYFRQLHAKFPLRVDGTQRVFTRAWPSSKDEAAADTNGVGRTGAAFLGSWIAGDNWVVEAKLHFRPDQAELSQAHQGHAAKLAAKTGTMTLWRRRQVAGALDLFANGKRPAVDFADVVAAFKAAHTHLVVPANPALQLSTLLDPAGKTEWIKIIADAINGGDVSGAAVRDDQVDPLPEPNTPVPTGSDADQHRRDILANRTSQLRNNWWVMFNGKLIGSDESKRGRGLRHVLLDALKKTKRPGFVVIRTDWLADRMIGGVNWSYPRAGDSSIGMPGGFALLSMAHCEQYRDGFIVGHEMAHTLFLQHSFNDNKRTWKSLTKAARDDLTGWENPVEHDLGDLNCLMSYPNDNGLKKTARPTVDASHTGASVLRFCGKCVLKLRGWRIAAGAAKQPPKPDDGGPQTMFDDAESGGTDNVLPYRSRSYADAQGGAAPP